MNIFNYLVLTFLIFCIKNSFNEKEIIKNTLNEKKYMHEIQFDDFIL